jgi:hypothetical protein
MDPNLATSHIYTGFRFVGALESIEFQREAQRSILKHLMTAYHSYSLLSVGTAFGDELDVLLDPELMKTIAGVYVAAVDCDCCVKEVSEKAFASQGKVNLSCIQSDLFSIDCVPGYGSFDAVQSGFVLHDFEYSQKDAAFRKLSQAVRIGGSMILSEIFSNQRKAAQQETMEIYDHFLREADSALHMGRLTCPEWRDLVGAASGAPGLLRTKEEAMNGDRDFFESVAATTERLVAAGLQVTEYVNNPFYPNLSVILAQRIR